jgi:catechol 2,3-dioxygenase-like lactoylglutathione lyase family enzyme
VTIGPTRYTLAVRIHHVALRTIDPERLRAFYVDVISLRERQRHLRDDGTLRSIWLGAGDAVLMLEAAEPGEPSIVAGSMEMFAFAVSASERAAFRSRCVASGIAIEAETRFTTYVRDPDGRRVACSEFAFDD